MISATNLLTGTMVDPLDTATFSDALTGKSWYLAGSALSSLRIDVEEVWEDYLGTGIKVAVVDSQIDYKHDDLKSAYDQSLDYSFAEGTDDILVRPASMKSAHGTMVAGVISSEADNGIGTVGIASGATLVGYALDYSSSGAVAQALAGIRAAANVDVVNNSWGFVSNFGDNFNSGDSGQEMEAALEHVVSEGRDGLGTSIVFAAGNMGESGTSNYHNFNNSPYTIAVGAVGADGEAASFTGIGANVLLSAAGVDVMTTSTNDAYKAVDGTSFAAPAVSAVIALMLEANPDLGYRDIQQILSLSSTREGLGDGVALGDGWITTGADGFNGGGMHFSDSFGYGFLNAYNAVRLAETWTKQQTLETRDTVETTVSVRETLVAGSNDHISTKIEVTEDMLVEHVQLSMNLNWSYTGDLDVYLTSPDGTQIRLVYDLPDTDRVGSIKGFEFSSVASMGEMSKGTWTLDIYNRNPDLLTGKGETATGMLRDVTLTVHGELDYADDDLYVYTDEFGTLYSGDDLASRSVLADDTGNDTINAAAVRSDTLIDLSGSQKSQIAGVTVAVAADDIENVFTGDGNDTIFGSGADNDIRTGRGDDDIYFSAGSDTVDGGEGTDAIHFGDVFGHVYGYITEAGSFMIGLLNKGYTMMTDVELYHFSDVSYSFDDLLAMFGDNTEPGTGSAPVDETPVDDTPAEETPEEPPVEETPEETPVDDTPEEETPEETPVDDTPEEETPVEDTPEDEADYEASIYGTDGEDRLRADSISTAIYGDDGDDYLVGDAGDDLLMGEAGNDKLRGGLGNDIMIGGDGTDTLLGNEGDDLLEGGAARDVLRGDEGNDTLIGGAGSDRLKGGEGADTFVFDIKDVGSLDIISDFDISQGDRIEIRGLGGNTATSVELVAAGRYTLLNLNDEGGSHTLAKVLGIGATDLAVTELSDDIFMLT